jgi:UDP-N-acetylglucosamine:LPS N-acetylglucosamine transferase
MTTLVPLASEMASVAAEAARLAGSTDECGEDAMKIRKDPHHAAATLTSLILRKRDQADLVDDSENQALYSILALHYHMRQNKGAGIKRLSADIAKLKQIEDGLEVTRAPKVFTQYYDGLRLHPPQANSRRALIFTCSFGGGHKSAARAVSDYLKTANFETVIVDTTYDEPFTTSSRQSSAKFFNEFVIKRQNYNIFNAMDKLNQMIGSLTPECPSPTCDSALKRSYRAEVLKQRPDLIVTVYHMELMPTLEIAKELGNIPVLHIATDFDIKMKEVFSKEMSYSKFRAGIPFELEESYETISPLVKKQTFVSGYPVRAAFLRPFDAGEAAQKKAQFVPADTKMLLIMTGGGGQDTPWPYTLAERGIGAPLHIVVIAGGNNALADKLREALPGDKTFPDGRVVWQGKDKSVTVEVARDPANKREDKPYFVLEDRLALLMDMADVMISKPGGGSTAEIAYRGVPAMFDTSVILFHWEMFTVEVFVKQRRGVTFNGKNGLRDAITSGMALGRSQSMAQEDGVLIDTKDRVVEQAEHLLTTTCNGCSLWGQ